MIIYITVHYRGVIYINDNLQYIYCILCEINNIWASFVSLHALLSWIIWLVGNCGCNHWLTNLENMHFLHSVTHFRSAWFGIILTCSTQLITHSGLYTWHAPSRNIIFIVLTKFNFVHYEYSVLISIVLEIFKDTIRRW